MPYGEMDMENILKVGGYAFRILKGPYMRKENFLL